MHLNLVRLAPCCGHSSPHCIVDQFICGSFKTENKVLSNNFQPVAILVRNPRNAEFSMADLSNMKTREAKQFLEDAEENAIVCMARQVVLNPNKQRQVHVTTTNSSGIIFIEQKILQSSRQCTLAAHGIMDVSPGRPTLILGSNFNGEAHLPMRMNVANTANPTTMKHAFDTDVPNTAIIETPRQLSIQSLQKQVT